MTTTEPIKFSGELVARPVIHQPSFDNLNDSRFDQIFLYYEENKKGEHRYCLTVVDRTILPTAQLDFPTAAFLVPAGRESEYMFSSKRGLQSIAESAKCARLIAVSFGRHHQFRDQTAVQEELTYVVQILSRNGEFLPLASLRKKFKDSSIPFVALGGIGKRDVLAECETQFSGKCLVEQVESEGSIVRRLYFVNNPFVIQSEAVLSKENLTVDPSALAFEYHKQMAAGILTLSNLHQQPSENPDFVSGIVIGLGGGGLMTFLQHILPDRKLAAIELDPSIVEVSKKYFGFQESDRTSVRIGDGLNVKCSEDEGGSESENKNNAISEKDFILFPKESASFIAIDVDSKDKTVGISCPPVAFLQCEYIQQLKKILCQKGLLAVNVSARDPKMLDLAIENIHQVFESVFISRRDDDEQEENDEVAYTNVVVYALCEKMEATVPVQELIERMDKVVQGRAVQETVYAEMKSSLSDIHLYHDETFQKGKNTSQNNNKKKAKRNKKRGKKK